MLKITMDNFSPQLVTLYLLVVIASGLVVKQVVSHLESFFFIYKGIINLMREVLPRPRCAGGEQVFVPKRHFRENLENSFPQFQAISESNNQQLTRR